MNTSFLLEKTLLNTLAAVFLYAISNKHADTIHSLTNIYLSNYQGGPRILLKRES